MRDKYFLDTSIFVYSFDKNFKEKQKIAQKLISNAVKSGKGVISYQIIQEFLNVATGKFKYAIKNDALLGNPQKSKILSEKFEKKVYKFFRNKKIAIITENELRQKQQKKYGRHIITPDLLFKNEMIINGQKIKWIDCKNYYGSATNNIMIKKNQKQIDKYTSHFGNGALLFAYGFNDELKNKLHNVMLLSFI